MESPEFFLAGSFRAGPPQISPEMKFCDIKSADFFPIEDLLDFSNEDAPGEFDVAAGNSTDSSTITIADTARSSNSSFSGDCRNLTDSHFPGDLCVPYDDLPELEWLSNFVEDSFSSGDFQKLQIVTGIKAKDDATGAPEYNCFPGDSSASDTPARQSPSFNPDAPVPARARSKRSRAAACNWSSRLVVLSPTTSSSGSTDTNADVAQRLPKESAKVVRRREVSEHPEGRRCLHCATEKTPQWRTGPLGPKTLCNACGVRYKSGRLVPEYRPAASPTFVLTKHSNSHRKVLELRRQKELQRSQQQLLQQAAGVFDVSAGSDTTDEFLIHTSHDFQHLI